MPGYPCTTLANLYPDIRSVCPKGLGHIVQGRVTQGTNRPRDISTKGRVIQGTHCPLELKVPDGTFRDKKCSGMHHAASKQTLMAVFLVTTEPLQ